MFGSIILDAAAGLVLVYLLLSLVASSIQETIASLLKTRSKMLDQGLHKLLGDPDLVAKLYDHPLISSLYEGDSYGTTKKRHLPSYIPSRNFAIALLDLIARGTSDAAHSAAGPESIPLSIDSVRARIASLGSPAVQRVVLTALDTAESDFAAARTNVENWFDSMMDRVSGWYKRRTQYVLFGIGLLLAALLDADSVRIAQELYREPAIRNAAVAIANGMARDTASARMAMDKIDTLSKPFNLTIQFGGVLPTSAELAIIAHRAAHGWFGWLLTAIAISFGAPFWFDALNKIMMLRSAIKPPPPPDPANGAIAPAKTLSIPPLVPGLAPGTTALIGPPSIQAIPVPRVEDSVAQTWSSGRGDGGVL